MDSPLSSTDAVGDEVPDRLTGEALERYHDLLWASSDPEVAQRYPDKIVAVHQRKVWAAGDDSEAVLREAAQNSGLPQEKFILTTIFGDKLFLMDF